MLDITCLVVTSPDFNEVVISFLSFISLRFKESHLKCFSSSSSLSRCLSCLSVLIFGEVHSFVVVLPGIMIGGVSVSHRIHEAD